MSIIAGFHSGHDCSFCILKDGIPIIHAELERYIRLKEPIDDSLKFLFKEYADFDKIEHFTTGIDIWNGGPKNRYPDTWKQMLDISNKNNGKYHEFGHHLSHAANAFYSSNFDEALIITIDGGGEEPTADRLLMCNFAVYFGNGNKVYKIDAFDDHGQGDRRVINMGSFWSKCTKNIFGLSSGYPKGHQAGTVMGMACLGTPKYYQEFFNYFKTGDSFNYSKYNQIASKSEQDTFDVAASLQYATEMHFKNLITPFIEKYDYENICISGGVSLNCVMAGKIYEWFPEIKSIYADPIPYDSGLTLGSARYLWHHIMDNPRIEWVDNATPYLGVTYNKNKVESALKAYEDKIKIQRDISNDYIVDNLISKNIISVFGGGSESGRRALGNRSILADPRHAETKDIVNERVKHRQWFRPFAPSILRDDVSDWFTRDIDSPYMSFAIPFKEEKKDLVPAVVHFDGTARLQTVTKNDNEWYYNLISLFKEKTGVPILLNTSFNDREPIVETPENAIKCFLGTDIDFLYFRDYKILVTRK